MKKQLKELGELILLLLLNILIAPLRACAVLIIANLFSLAFITQFSFVQILGIVCVFKLISFNVENKGLKKEEKRNMIDKWKTLGLRILHIVLSVVIAYLFFWIFN